MSSSTNTSREQPRDKSSDNGNTGSLPHGKQRRGRSEQSLHEQLYLLEQQFLHQQYLRRQHRLKEKYLQLESLEEKYLEQQYHLQQQYLKQHGVLPPPPPPQPQQWIPGQTPPQQGASGQDPPQQQHPLQQQQAPDRSSPQQQYPPEQSSSSSSSTDEMQHGDLTSSFPLPPLPDSTGTSVDSSRNVVTSSGKACEEGVNPIVKQQSSPPQPSSQPQPSAQQKVWLTIQNYSMFLNTMPSQSRENAQTQRSPCTRASFTLCSLADYISQFDLTDPNAINKVKTDEEYLMYDDDLYSHFPSAIRPVTMTLYFMFHAPQIRLPLAPFHDAIYSVIEFCHIFWWGHKSSMWSFDVICRMVTGILSRRIAHAVSCLYPQLKLAWGDRVPQVEHDKPPILEWLARDTLAAFNPIEIMLVYYRPIVTEFKQIPSPTPEDRQLSFQKVIWISSWLAAMRPICMMYGLHIYDSQWVSIEEWTELAGYMRIIATEMAPDLFDVVQGNHPDPATNEERREIVFTKDCTVLHRTVLYPPLSPHWEA